MSILPVVRSFVGMPTDFRLGKSPSPPDSSRIPVRSTFPGAAVQPPVGALRAREREHQGPALGPHALLPGRVRGPRLGRLDAEAGAGPFALAAGECLGRQNEHPAPMRRPAKAGDGRIPPDETFGSTAGKRDLGPGPVRIGAFVPKSARYAGIARRPERLQAHSGICWVLLAFRFAAKFTNQRLNWEYNYESACAVLHSKQKKLLKRQL